MKIDIERNALLQKLKHAARVAQKSSTLPILSTVLLEASDDTLHITANNLDLGLATTAPAEVEEPGKLAVCCSRLLAAVSRMTGDAVKMWRSKSVLHIECGSDMARLQTLDAAEFPEVSAVKAPEWSGQVSGIAAAFSAVAAAVSKDQTRYTLNGIFLDGTVGLAVATDGRRMMSHKLETHKKCNAIVPHPALSLVAGMGEDTLAVKCSKNAIAFTGLGWTVTSKLIEGEFPNYDQVIPSASGRTITASRARLLQAVGFAESVLPANVESVRLEANGTDRLRVQASGPEIGEAESVLDAQAAAGFRAAFNPAFFVDLLKAVKSDEFTLDMRDEISPAVVRDGDLVAVLMPLRIS